MDVKGAKRNWYEGDNFVPKVAPELLEKRVESRRRPETFEEFLEMVMSAYASGQFDYDARGNARECIRVFTPFDIVCLPMGEDQEPTKDLVSEVYDRTQESTEKDTKSLCVGCLEYVIPPSVQHPKDNTYISVEARGG